MKPKSLNKAWLHQHLNDPYVQAAQKEGYRSRAAYKLQEIDEVFKLFTPSAAQVVVDLGCAPGAWSQYVSRKLAGKGSIFALDLLEMEPLDGVHYIQGDFRSAEALEQLEAALDGRKVDVVISDMAPNLSGHASTDAARSAHLVELALDFSATHLHPRGVLVAKVFHGASYNELVSGFRAQFERVKAHKPRASRSKSAETFLIGQRLR